MGTCTVIALAPEGGSIAPHFVRCFIPLKEALAVADELKRDKFISVRVFAEANGGLTLTLIYQP